MDNIRTEAKSHKNTILFFFDTQDGWKRTFREIPFHKSSTDFDRHISRTTLIIRNIRKLSTSRIHFYLSTGCYQLFFLVHLQSENECVGRRRKSRPPTYICYMHACDVWASPYIGSCLQGTMAWISPRQSSLSRGYRTGYAMRWGQNTSLKHDFLTAIEGAVNISNWGFGSVFLNIVFLFDWWCKDTKIFQTTA